MGTVWERSLKLGRQDADNWSMVIIAEPITTIHKSAERAPRLQDPSAAQMGALVIAGALRVMNNEFAAIHEWRM